MRIGLIDVDGHNFPNIALMKISAYYKNAGHEVEWYQAFSDRYDIVFVAKVFSFTPDWEMVINADTVVYGGTGYQIHIEDGLESFNYLPKDAFKKFDNISLSYKRWGYEMPTPTHGTAFWGQLPQEIEMQYPDYSLYPNTKDTAYGFLTRGCPRGCAFCHVEAKEGKKSYKVANLSDFWNGQKNIVLCDPNILACKEWKPLLQQLIDSKACVDFNQGLDIRMMTDEKAEMISQIKIKEIHFAWDRYEDKDIILPKLKLFSDIKYKGKNPDHSAIVYVLVNFDTTIEQDLERIYTLRDMGYWAYVMIYDKEHESPIYKDIARWVNNRPIFAKCLRFEDYKK
jgi:hypothetical protein